VLIAHLHRCATLPIASREAIRAKTLGVGEAVSDGDDTFYVPDLVGDVGAEDDAAGFSG
jgi:hypothetical protein